MKTKDIISKSIMFGIVAFIVVITTGLLVHSMANNLCIEYDQEYYRWQETGGLFGGKEKVYTTEERADGITNKCSKYLGSLGVDKIAENVERIANYSRRTP